MDLEDAQPLHQPIGRNRARKDVSSSSSSIIDIFGENFDQYVQVQESKTELMSRWNKNDRRANIVSNKTI